MPAYLHDDTPLDPRPDVVATAVTERRQQLIGRQQLQDPRVLRLRWRHPFEVLLGQHLAEVFRRLRLDHKSRHL